MSSDLTKEIGNIDNILLADDEKIIRKYTYDKSFNNVYFLVTTKRIIKAVTSDSPETYTFDVKQYFIEDIKGIKSGIKKTKPQINVAGLMLSILSAIAFFVFIVTNIIVGLLISGLITVIGIVWCVVGSKGAVITAYMYMLDASSDTIISIETSIENNLLCKMANEIAAIMLDVKNSSNAACDKWVKDSK